MNYKSITTIIIELQINWKWMLQVNSKLIITYRLQVNYKWTISKPQINYKLIMGELHPLSMKNDSGGGNDVNN
jgi:hypothetical protein